MALKEKTIFFHIPKTAGTSFMKGVVEANFPESQILHVGSMKRWLRQETEHARFIKGHVPVGIDNWKRLEANRVTFLRDPIERCISWYYFVKDCPPETWSHEDRPLSEQLSIGDFYSIPRFGNVQTRYLAGLLPFKFPRLFANEQCLRKAMTNLEGMACFGIQKHYQESIKWIMTTLGWENKRVIERQKSASNRIRVSDLDPADLEKIKHHNQLDQRLYEFGLKLFEERTRSLQ